MERLYRRVGARIILVLCAWGTAVVVLAMIIALACIARYLGLSTTEFVASALFMLVGGPIGAAAILWLWCRDILRVGLSWTGAGRSAARAPLIWRTVVGQTRQTTRIALLADSLAFIPLSIGFCLAFDQPLYTAIAVYATLMASVLVSAVLWTFGGDLMLRPMLRDVAGFLPRDHAPPEPGSRLHTKALGPLAVVTLFGTLMGGAFVDSVDNGALRLTLALAIAAVIVVFAGAVFYVVTRSALEPLDDLLAATREAQRGHLDSRLPVVTDDDLGALTANFNTMLAQLERSAEELRTSRARIVAASDAERRRIERNIHDGAQQQLVGLTMKLHLLEEQVSDEATRGDLVTIRERLLSTLEELRELAQGLHPAVLTTDGLRAALEQLADGAPMPVAIQAAAERFPATVETTAYFVASEALANAAKHAAATQAQISAVRDNGRLLIEVVDDGIGGARVDAGSGLAGLADRVSALGGQLAVDSPPGKGTNIRAELPLT